jgi:type II secretory pathway pseudopilin PulG
MIDMLVATVLLGMAVAVMMFGFAYASAGTRENRGRVQAIMLAQETLENLKRNDGADGDTFDLKLATPTDATNESGNGTTNYMYNITQDGGVEYTVSITAATANGLANLRAVTSTVAWTEAEINHSLSMVEYIYLK